MKIIITGSRGFIGKNLLNFFQKKHRVRKLIYKNISLLNEEKYKKKLEKIFSKFKPDIIIHAATKFSKKKDKEIKKECLKINYKYSKVLYKVAVSLKIKKFIYFGSNYEFEKDKNKLYPYLLSKIKFSKFLKKADNKDTTLLAIYLFNTFGVGDKRGKFYSKILENPKKKVRFLNNLKINYINVNSLINYIDEQIKIDKIKQKKFICLMNKEFFTIKHINQLKLKTVPFESIKKLTFEHKLKIPEKKVYIKDKLENSLHKFLEKRIL